jgi:hypothetical protein
VVAPRAKLAKFIGATACSIALVGVPLLVLTSGRAITSILVGTGDVGGSNLSLYGIPLHNSLALAAIRLVPLALCAFLAWWALSRLGVRVLEPLTLLSLLALSLAMRLAFETTLYGYYLMSVSVLLLLVQITAGRIKVLYIVWTGIATWATVGGGLVDHGTFAGIAVQLWQLLIVVGAIYLAAQQLRAALGPKSPITTATHLE